LILGSRLHSLPFDQVGSKHLRTFAGKSTLGNRIQWTPLNGITLGQAITDDTIKQMIKITEYGFLFKVCY